jgi:predicted aspartyl protease
MSLSEFLRREGYRQVPLGRNGVGHFEAKGSLAGRAIRALVDTGAASTVISLSFRLRASLAWK